MTGKLSTLSALFFAFVLSGCIQPDDKPFNPAQIQSVYGKRITENSTRIHTPMPTQLNRTYLDKIEGKVPTERSRDVPTMQSWAGPSIRMPLRDLIQLAAANSLDVKIAGYQPAIDEARVIEAEARFDPTFFSQVNFANQWLLSPSTSNSSFVSAESTTNFETLSAAMGLRQDLPTGGRVELSYNISRVFRDTPLRASTPFDPPNRPFFETNLSLQLQQPLLRNFGTETNRARIVVARYTQQISLMDFRLQLERQLGEIEEAYWQLVLAESDLRIQERLFDKTVETSRQLQSRLGNDVERPEIAQANAALRSREALLVDLRKRVQQLSHEIKVRVNDPDLPVSSPITILPADEPIDAPISFDLAEQIETALSSRADLAQQEMRVNSARVVVRAAKNNLLPELNLVGSIGTKGAGANIEEAWETQFADWDFREYAIGLQFEIPLGNREARAIEQRTRLQLQQTIEQYRLVVERACLEVKNAHDDVYFAWEKLAKSRQARFAARESIDALEQQAETKGYTADFVNRLLNAQEILAQAAREEARALAEYNTGIASLERAKGTILKYDNVLMKEEPLLTNGVKKPAKKP